MTFRGQNLLLCGMISFLLVAISNFAGSLGFFVSTAAGNSGNYFMIHPLIFWGQTPVFLLGCLTCGIGAWRIKGEIG